MKKVLCLVSALALTVASFVGCGDDATTNGTTSGSTTGSTSSEVTDASSDESTNDAITTDGEVWKIGAIGPLTGSAAVYGIAVKNGAQLAVDEINANGGINSIQIEYRAEDDEADGEKSVNAYNALKDWEMNLLVGTTTSGACVAVANETQKDNLFQITPSASSVDAVKNDNIFQVCFSDPNQGVGAATYIGQNSMATKVGVIYDSSDIYSSGIFEKFMLEADNQPFEIVAAEAFTEESKVDFSVQIQKMMDNEVELVFLPIYYAEASNILTQANAKGYSPMFFGGDGLDGILTGVEGFDLSLTEGLMLLTPFAADATDQLTVDFVMAYESAFGETPNQFAADAYDAVYILKAAIEHSGATPADGISGISDKLKVAITEIIFDGTTGLGMTWNANGEVNKEPKAMKIVDGVYSLIQ